MGKQDVFSTGAVLITSPKQGRVFEVFRNEKTFEFINRYNEAADEVLVVTGAKFLSNDFFKPDTFDQCE